jgi:hypothetical protein
MGPWFVFKPWLYDVDAAIQAECIGHAFRQLGCGTEMFWPASFNHLGRTCQEFPGMAGPMRCLGYGDSRARVLTVAVLPVSVLRRYRRKWCGPQPGSATAAVPDS